MRFEPISREQFLAVARHPVLDKFAKTFRAKADALKLWPTAVGAFRGEQLMAAACVRISKREPFTANFQLLHTFAKYRHQGVASALVRQEYGSLYGQGVKYFRISSEIDAVEFYRKLGLRFWGKQKSLSLLCMHKIMSTKIEEGSYVLDDTIEAAIHSGRKGCLMITYKVPR